MKTVVGQAFRPASITADLKVCTTAALILLATACTKPEPYDAPLTPVTIATVASTNTGTAVRYSATVKPAVEVGVAFKVGGYVESLLSVRDDQGRPRDVQEGDRVAKGAALARVRPSDFQQRVAQARSGLAEAEAMHESARLNYERVSRLYEKRSVTKPEFDGARTQLDAASARIAGAKAMVGETQLMLDDVTLRSPISGVVLKRSIENGMLAGPGQQAFILADTSSVKVSFGVPDVAVKALTIGRPQRIAFDALKGQTFEGRITSIAPSPDPVSRVYEIEVTIPNPERQIEVGFIASLQLEDAAGAQVQTVPLASIVTPPGKSGEYAVYVVEGDKDKTVARLRPVTLGEPLGNSIVVNTGLAAGDRVIVRGATLVKDGEAVRLIQ